MSEIETPAYGAAIEIAHFSGRTSLVYSCGERKHNRDLFFGEMKSARGVVDKSGASGCWRYPGETEWRK